jgi:hypothetical protein
MSDSDRDDAPPRLLNSENDIERLLARSARLDDEQLQARRALREATATRARLALRAQPRSRARRALGAGLACAAAFGVWFALLRVPREAPPIAEPVPRLPSPSASGNAVPVPERCPATVVADGLTLLIDDFEDRNARLTIHDGRSGSWLANGDAKAKQQPRAGTTAFPQLLPKPRAASRYALHFSGGQLASGAGLDASFAPGHCYDASPYGGVELWAKGPGRVHVMVSMIDMLERKWGGLCDSGCYDPHRAALDLGREWQRFAVRWDELEQVGYGTRVAFDPKRLSSLQFFVEGADSPFDLWIDDVAFTPR